MTIFDFFSTEISNREILVIDNSSEIHKFDKIFKKSSITLEELNELELFVKANYSSRIKVHSSKDKKFSIKSRYKQLFCRYIKMPRCRVQISQAMYKSLLKKVQINPIQDFDLFLKEYLPESKNGIIKCKRGTFRIYNIYEVISTDQEREFAKLSPIKTEVLFHGSSRLSFFSIIKNNLRKGKHGMFGAGIYLANEFSKSAQYSNCGRLSRCAKGQKRSLVGMFEVDVTNLKEFKNGKSGQRLNTLREQTNIIKCLKGKTLVSDEYVLYKKGLTKIKYLIEFDSL